MNDPTTRLVEAAKALFRLVESGVLVRDISRDHEEGWSLRAMHIVSVLKHTEEALRAHEQSQQGVDRRAVLEEAAAICDLWKHTSCNFHDDDPCCHARTANSIATKIRALKQANPPAPAPSIDGAMKFTCKDAGCSNSAIVHSQDELNRVKAQCDSQAFSLGTAPAVAQEPPIVGYVCRACGATPAE